MTPLVLRFVDSLIDVPLTKEFCCSGNVFKAIIGGSMTATKLKTLPLQKNSQLHSRASLSCDGSGWSSINLCLCCMQPSELA